MSKPDPGRVRNYLLELQKEICSALEQMDGGARFGSDPAEDPDVGFSLPRVMAGGRLIEKAGVHFSHSRGSDLPRAATGSRPQLAGRSFQAVSLSLIVHPVNPFVPTTHMNLRFFLAEKPEEEPVWWFGGGFDLTPVYGFEEDAIHWHRTTKAACEPFGGELYPRFKKACDEYFYLPHRKENRGVGGLFFDDHSEGGFDRTFEFVRSVGDHFLPGYLPIVERRRETPYGEREREFQRYRRGRYAEFNLLYDRGTRYGLQSGRRVEAVLSSMPPEVRWEYGWEPEPGTPEAELVNAFLTPRDWLAEAGSAKA